MGKLDAFIVFLRVIGRWIQPIDGQVSVKDDMEPSQLPLIPFGSCELELGGIKACTRGARRRKILNSNVCGFCSCWYENHSGVYVRSMRMGEGNR